MLLSKVFRPVAWVGMCVFASALLFGQFEAGSILGTVRDPSGAVVPGASVVLENVGTGVKLMSKTDNEGSYEFINQRVGTYRVQVQAAGFQTAVAQNFDLTINARQRVDLALQVGEATQSVMVTGAASLLETETSSRGQVINPKQMVELPLNGRAYADLTLLVPGVAKSFLENQSDSSRDASFNVNGQRSELNNFMLDGVDNNAYGTSNQGFSNQVIQPNPDALSEFKVETNNYSAEYGRSTGAVINASIKSGTNALHGELWEFVRNTEFNATGFFKPVGGVKPPFNQNQFGAAMGGPIKKDKIFVFGDYEGFRRVFHPILFATLPTAAMKAGSFGQSVKNPYTGEVYANGIVPQSQIIPLAQAVFSALPDPNLPGNSNNYSSAPSDTISSDKGDFRYDHYINSKITAFVRYSQNDLRIFSPPAIQGPAGGNANGNVYAKTKQLVPGVTWTITPTSVLEARINLDTTHAGKTPQALGTPLGAFAVPNLPSDSLVAGGLYSLNFSGGLSQLGRQSSNPQFQNPLVIDPKVNFTKILQRHSLKFGIEFQAIDTQVNDFHPQYGVDNYTGFFSAPGSTSGISGLQQQIYSLTDFMFGARNHYELDNNPIVHLRQRMYFGYVQDDFRVSSKLTLNLGMRYEFATPQYERDNLLANFDPVNVKMIFAKDGDLYSRSLVHPDKKNFAPRVGMAYSVTPNTVIRSGFGISYVQFNRLGGENLLPYNGPNVVDAIIDGQTPAQGVCTSVSDAAGACFRPTQLGFPANFATPAAFNTATTQVRYIPADNRTGYVESWHFSIQQKLAKDLVLDVGYVGNHDVGLMILADYNQAAPNLLNQNLSINARRPLSTFNTIEMAYDGGFGSYNALQVKLEKRFSHGFYFLNSFTWSKAIDNAPGHLENYNGDNSRINIRNSALEKGVSSFNQPVNNTTSVLYDLPIGKDRMINIHSRALDYVIGGWSLNLSNYMTSGLPLNITYSASSQFQVSPLVSMRPNIIGDPYTPAGQRTTANYFNVASFSLPSYTQPFGTLSRNVARSFPFYEMDLGIHKNIPLWKESTYVQFRAEAFNLQNRTNFSPPNTTFNSTSFGSVTSTFPARQIQLSLKFYF